MWWQLLLQLGYKFGESIICCIIAAAGSHTWGGMLGGVMVPSDLVIPASKAAIRAASEPKAAIGLLLQLQLLLGKSLTCCSEEARLLAVEF
jgi:hypothetical protein